MNHQLPSLTLALRRLSLLLLCLLASCAVVTNQSQAGAVTASGISAGGIMAQQLHLAYPEVYSGVGLVAAPPWGCSGGQLMRALGQCTAQGNDVPPVAELQAMAREMETSQQIGSLSALADDRVWMFHGARDAAVARAVSDAVDGFYAGWIPEGNRVYVTDVPAAHHFPALEADSACDEFVSPFMGDCDFDAAGELLSHLYPGLEQPSEAVDGDRLQQQALPGAAEAGLLDQAWVYMPQSCPDAGCGVHVVLHGCTQSTEQVGDQFVRHSGFLRWAQSNQLILAFPQVLASPVNPLACWDWWGYSGADYASRDGAQVRVITEWVNALRNDSMAP